MFFLKKEKIWNKGFTTVTLAHTLISIGMYMVTPTFPLFLVSLSATKSQVGMVATSFYISSILTRFLVNLVLPKLGKKRILIIGVILNIATMSLYGLTKSIGAATLLHIIQGMGLGGFSVAAATMAVDFLPDSRRGEGVGYFSLGVVMAMSVAPAIALYVRSDYGFLPMFLVAAFTNFTSVIIAFFIDEPRVAPSKPREDSEQAPKIGGWRSMYDLRLLLPSLFSLLFGVCRAVDLNYIALFAEERNLDHLSWFFVIQTAAMFCIRLITGRLADRKGRNWVLIPGGFALLALMVTLSLATTSFLLLLGAFFSGLGSGVLAPNLQLWMFNSVEPERRTVASASYFSCVEIGGAIAAPLMGYIAENHGYTSMFHAGAVAAMLYIAGYIVIGRERKERKLGI